MTGIETVLIASTVLSAVGSLAQGIGGFITGNQNAKYAKQNAANAAAIGAANADKERRLSALRLGQAKAGYGASGVTMEGSPLLVIEDQAMQGELDALNAKYAGDMQAYNYKLEASQQKQAAWGALGKGIFGAASSILSPTGGIVGGGGGGAGYASIGVPSLDPSGGPSYWGV